MGIGLKLIEGDLDGQVTTPLTLSVLEGRKKVETNCSRSELNKKRTSSAPYRITPSWGKYWIPIEIKKKASH